MGTQLTFMKHLDNNRPMKQLVTWIYNSKVLQSRLFLSSSKISA